MYCDLFGGRFGRLKLGGGLVERSSVFGGCRLVIIVFGV